MTTSPEVGSSGGGIPLRELIGRYGALSPESALLVLRESLLGLAAAYERGTAHRDYRPESVLVDGDGNCELTDYGVPANEGMQAPEEPTPYQAPELRDGAPASQASNLYAATAVLFECLTGLAPSPERITQFRGEQLAVSVPIGQAIEPLRDLMARGMAANPADRPASAGDFIAELDDMASALFGPDWRSAGRRELAERVAGTLALGPGAAGNAGGGPLANWLAGHRRARHAGIAIVAAVVVLGVAGAAVALSGHFDPKPSHSASSAGQGSASGSASSAGQGSPSGSAAPSPTARPSTARPSTARSTAPPSTVKTSVPSGGNATFTATVTPPATTSTRPYPTPTAPASSQPLAIINNMDAGGGGAFGTIGVPYSVTDTAINGKGPYTWSATGLPPGLRINASTGTISGTPTTAGGYGVAVTVTDSESPPQSASADTNMVIYYPPVHITATTLPNGTVGTAYPAVTFSATGGDGTYTWFTAPDTTLPPGLSLSASGVLSGTPAKAGTFTLYLSVSDTSTGFATTELTLVINPAQLPITTASDLRFPILCYGLEVTPQVVAHGSSAPSEGSGHHCLFPGT